MIKIAILGDIGSGKSFIAKQFGYPVFNADNEVWKIYSKDKKCYKKLKKAIPKHILSFPINKKEITKSILSNQKNLKKVIKIVHPIVRMKMNKFINKNKKKKLIVFDVPLLLENKIEKKANILIFIEAKKKEIIKNLKRRKNYNLKIIKILKKFQLPLKYKKKKSNFVIKNNFKMQPVKKNVKLLKKKLLTK
jgi:dephospho-CoA kinase|tara:strand:+ start:1518 stop:2093 length:576 start_codon:yes stop_codon:yes gene_type:complete